MDYIKRYHLIANAMLDFEKRGCDFYLALASHPALEAITTLTRQIAYDKAKELDIFSGMVTVSTFLLNDSQVTPCECGETAEWLSANTPDIYNDRFMNEIVIAGTIQKTLAILIKLEKTALAFCRNIRKKIPMGTTQIDSIIARQQRQIAALTGVTEQLFQDEYEDRYYSKRVTVTT